jgi:transaldolase
VNETKPGYFHRVVAETPTEFWVNNPTLAEAQAGLAAGAMSASTNPTYPARLLKEDTDYLRGLIDASLACASDDRAAEVVYEQAVGNLCRLFQANFERTNGRYGFVAIQGDPRVNSDPDPIIESAHRYRTMAENIIIKVPSTPAGAVALDHLASLGIPSIATLCFSVDQAVFMAETYRRARARASRPAVCYITFIAGILDEHLTEQCARLGNPVPPEWIRYAGCAATREAYRIFQQRAYEAILIGGGARGPHHFAELVGGKMAVTIGWNLAEQMIAADGPVVPRINAVTAPEILADLEKHLPDFRKAFYEKSMKPEEFRDFGPVVRFQNTFLAGMDTLLKAIAARRAEKAPTHAGR